jgi:uncharacterized membrane protein
MAQFHVIAGAGDMPLRPAIRRISFSDLAASLREGLADFLAAPSHVFFIVLLYPIIGVILATATSRGDALHLAFPLAAGFALIGPFAAIGLYEISRRREAGEATTLGAVLDLRHSPALPALAALGIYLTILFVAWLLCAQSIYTHYLGAAAPGSLESLLSAVLSGPAGWQMMLVGNLAGLVFAIVVLATTCVAFPMLVHRDAGAYAAVETSMRVFAANPVEILAWGLIVAGLLVIAIVPLFAGLIVVLPILGHATWHLYRRAVATG